MHDDVARMAIDAAALNLVIAVVMLPLSYGLSVLFFRVLVALEKMSGPKASKSPNLPG